MDIRYAGAGFFSGIVVGILMGNLILGPLIEMIVGAGMGGAAAKRGEDPAGRPPG